MGAESGAEIFRRYDEIVQRHALKDVDLACLTGLSTHTIRLTRVAGQLPPSQRSRDAIAAFVQLNANACQRGDLRLVG